MAQRWSVRGWVGGAGLACVVALVGVVPVLTVSASVPVRTSGPAVGLGGALAPGSAPVAAGYPAATDASWPRTTTPDRRFTVTIGGRDRSVACLDLCDSIVPGDYSADSVGPEIASVTRILTAAAAAPDGLAEPAEAAAVQSAIWYVTEGFVLDADTDQAIRRRVTNLLSAAAVPVSTGGGSPTVGTVLVGVEPDQPRLVVTDNPPPAEADSGADGPEIAVFAAADEAPSSSDTATVTPTTTTTSTTTATATSPPATSEALSSAQSSVSEQSSSTSSTGTTAGSATVIYENCTAVWVAIGRPLYAWDPGYTFELDRDRDGIACEIDPGSTDPTSTDVAVAVAVGEGGSGSSGAGSDGSLASSGFAANPMLVAGGALVLLGGSLVIMTRPRRPSPTHR